MSALDDLYRQQPAHEWVDAEQAATQQTAEELGISFRQAEYERAKAAAEYRKAEQERVAAIVNDPVRLRRLKDYWAPVPLGQQRPPNPLEAPAPPTPDPNRPPSAGRTVSGGDGRTVWGAGSRAGRI